MRFFLSLLAETSSRKSGGLAKRFIKALVEGIQVYLTDCFIATTATRGTTKYL
jgi:hypothetical protein